MNGTLLGITALGNARVDELINRARRRSDQLQREKQTPMKPSTKPMKAIVLEGDEAPERVLKLNEVDRPSVGDDDVPFRPSNTPES